MLGQKRVSKHTLDTKENTPRYVHLTDEHYGKLATSSG
jgi:hypothetical protein